MIDDSKIMAIHDLNLNLITLVVPTIIINFQQSFPQ